MNTTVHSHFRNQDPILFAVAEKYQLPELHPHPDYFANLCNSIVSQQLSEKAGSTIFARFEALLAQKGFTPTTVASLSVEEIRSIGVSRQKASYIIDLASKVMAGEVELAAFETISDDTVIAELTKVKGIGRWTAEMFLIFSLGREDVFSCGDVGLQRAIQNLYGLESKPSVAYMLELSSRWAPYRSYASRWLWKSLENEY